MGPINKALDEIKFRIPKQILDLIFVQRTNVWGNTNWKNNVISIDECIMSTVIRPRVLVDCNLVGGAEVFIPLEAFLLRGLMIIQLFIVSLKILLRVDLLLVH